MVLGLNFFFQLMDLKRCLFKVSSELGYLILSLNQILRVKISVGSYCFIQVLLLLKLAFKFNVLFFELTDQVLLQLYLFDHLHQVCVGFGSFVGESVSFLLKLVNLLEELCNVFLFSSALLLELGDFVVLLTDFILVLIILIFSLLDVF